MSVAGNAGGLWRVLAYRAAPIKRRHADAVVWLCHLASSKRIKSALGGLFMPDKIYVSTLSSLLPGRRARI